MFCDLDSARPVHLHRIIQFYSHVLPSLVLFFKEASALKIIKKMVSTKVPSKRVCNWTHRENRLAVCSLHGPY